MAATMRGCGVLRSSMATALIFHAINRGKRSITLDIKNAPITSPR